MGLEYSARLSYKLETGTMASVSTHCPPLVNSATATDQRGSCRDGSKEGCRANTPIKRVLFQSISSPQEGRGSVTHHKPQSSELICSEATL